jgi:hypothetical protein
MGLPLWRRGNRSCTRHWCRFAVSVACQGPKAAKKNFSFFAIYVWAKK